MTLNKFFTIFRNNIIKILKELDKSNIIIDEYDFDKISLKIRSKICEHFNEDYNDDKLLELMQKIRLGSLRIITKNYTIYDIYSKTTKENQVVLYENFKNLIIYLHVNFELFKLSNINLDKQVKLEQCLEDFKKDLVDLLRTGPGVTTDINIIIRDPVFLAKFIDLIMSDGFKLFCKLKIQDQFLKIDVNNETNLPMTDDNTIDTEKLISSLLQNNKKRSEYFLDFFVNNILTTEFIGKVFDLITIIKYNENKVLRDSVHYVDFINLFINNSKTIKEIFKQKKNKSSNIDLTHVTYVDSFDENLFDIDFYKYFKMIYIDENKFNYSYPIFLNKFKIFASHLINTIKFYYSKYDGNMFAFIKKIFIDYNIIEINNTDFDKLQNMKNIEQINVQKINISEKIIKELYDLFKVETQMENESFITLITTIKTEIENIFKKKESKLFTTLHDSMKKLIFKQNIFDDLNYDIIFTKLIEYAEMIFNFKINKELCEFLKEKYLFVISEFDLQLKEFKEIYTNNRTQDQTDIKNDAENCDSEIGLFFNLLMSVDNYFQYDFTSKACKALDDAFGKLLNIKLNFKNKKMLKTIR